MIITKGLIIGDPWIGYLLDGSKTWEMRAKPVKFRGWFGLIRKGSGAVQGIARLVDVRGPLSREDMLATVDKHRIPAEMITSGAVAKWTTPWIISDVRPLSKPVPYRHPYGAVTWIELDKDVADAIAIQVGGLPQTSESANTSPASPPATSTTVAMQEASVMTEAPTSAPKTSDRLIGQVEITQGNINHHHIYLRSFFDRFPDDAIGGSNRQQKAARDVTVDWGGGDPVQTDLDGAKQFFRARGWIRTFFELNGAQAGDVVEVYEAGPYAYRVRMQPR